MTRNKFLVVTLFIILNVFSQQKSIKHTIEKGESLYSISKKYNVSIEAISKLNSNSNGILKLHSVLLIPNKFVEIEEKSTLINHTIIAKETLYGIAKNYKTTISEIKKANPSFDFENLKVGSEIKIPTKKLKSEIGVTKPIEKEIVQNQNQEEIIHEVLLKETKYGISKKYGITIATLEKLNPEITKELSVGSKLIIKTGSKANTKTEQVAEIKEEVKEIKKDSISSSGEPYAILIPIYEKADLPDKLIATASENIGTTYRSGGKTKGGFDCSGLMIYTFGTYDIQLPRTSAEQSQYGKTISQAEAQKGDLIFFSTNGRGNINHVGMITEVNQDEIKFIHSSVHGGVIISSNKETYYQRCFVKINRVLE
jgi:peptidoglycan DL-endopeptidase LytE